MGCGLYRTQTGTNKTTGSKKISIKTSSIVFNMNALRNPKRKGLYPINEANSSQEMSLPASKEFIMSRFSQNPNITTYQSENQVQEL